MEQTTTEVRTDHTPGTTVSVTYMGSYRGREHTITGEVVTDPYTHRPTPDDALDARINGDDGSYIARITAEGTVYGLDHATRRHDHRKGGAAIVSVADDEACATCADTSFCMEHEA